MNVISPNLPASFPPASGQEGSLSARSPENRRVGANEAPARAPGSSARTQGNDGPSEDRKGVASAGRSARSEQGLDEQELKQLTELKSRDREVRAHEAAHQAAGGQHAGAMSLTYERGPDGAQYAVGGEVSIDMSSVQGDPQATIEKMRMVRAAAMAPAEPSGQDRAVAAQAMQMMLQAQSELASEKSDGARNEPDAERTDKDVSQSRSGQQANDTYQSVSAMTTDAGERQSGFRPVAA